MRVCDLTSVKKRKLGFRCWRDAVVVTCPTHRWTSLLQLRFRRSLGRERRKKVRLLLTFKLVYGPKFQFLKNSEQLILIYFFCFKFYLSGSCQPVSRVSAIPLHPHYRLCLRNCPYCFEQALMQPCIESLGRDSLHGKVAGSINNTKTPQVQQVLQGCTES